MVAKDIVTASRPSPGAGILQRPGGQADGLGMPQWSRALLRAVTHELRSPLTVIRAYSTAVLNRGRRLSRDELAEIMQSIDRSARLVEVIVSDLETIVKQESVAFRPEIIDLRGFLTDQAPDLQALAPGRALSLEFESDFLRLEADPLRLKQVLNNLVENSHKYSRPGGGITISVGAARNLILIAVQDEGPGISPAEVDQAFEPFFRGSREVEVSGSGLGLAICKSLVEAQGGGLRAAPAPGDGFQMLLTLPAAA